MFRSEEKKDSFPGHCRSHVAILYPDVNDDDEDDDGDVGDDGGDVAHDDADDEDNNEW